MQLLKTDVAKFQSIYKAKFGLEVNYKTAHKQLSMLVRQLEIVYRPITKKQLETFTKNEDEKKDDNDNRMAAVAN